MADADTHFDDEKLVVSNPNQRNWRGILIALLVIAAVLALIVTSVVLLTPPDEGPRVKGRRMKLNDLLSSDLEPLMWNGTWISGDEFIFQDQAGGISLMNASNKTSKPLMSNTTFRTLSPASFSLSADRRFLLLAQNVKKLYKKSFLAQYTVYDILTLESYPLTPIPDDSSKGTVLTEGPYLLQAFWTPKGHGLVTVWNQDIYYRPAPRSSTGYRITETAVPGVIFNGVPDWLYEEEILPSNSAIWMSGDGHMMLFATFNDSLVQEEKYPWYGRSAPEDIHPQLYPEMRSIRMPKAGTANPKVTLTIADIADPKHIRTRHVKPPEAIAKEHEHYFTSAQWISLTEICVVWLNRAQNLSVVSLCKSPMWYCQEVYRVTADSSSWVDAPPTPLWSSSGTSMITLAPVRDGPTGLFRHAVRVEYNSAHAPRALALTHGSYDVTKLLYWDQVNKIIYFLAVPEAPLQQGHQHLYRVSSETPRPGSTQKPPYCITCNEVSSPGINLEYYGSLTSAAAAQTTDWDSEWDEEVITTLEPVQQKKRKKKHQTDDSQAPQHCLYHEVYFSKTASYFILECLGPDVPRHSLYKTSLPEQVLVMDLQNNSAVKEHLSQIAVPAVRTFSVQISGGYSAQVRLLLPPGLREDEITKYPLVVYVGGVPGSQLVTDEWVWRSGWGVWGAWAVAARGAVLAAVDGRTAGGQVLGGSGRGRGFRHRLGGPDLADQLEVTEYLLSLPFIDGRRVAIYGWSYGGFLTTLALANSMDVFHCGIAVSPVTRWRYYNSFISERYMGHPNATGAYRAYVDSDATQVVAGIRDKLLLVIHGTAHAQHAAALVDALADNGVLFRQQVYVDEFHELSGVKRHLYRTMAGFLEDCFRKLVPPETKSGLRNGGNLD